MQAWRPEMTADEEVRARLAALLPAWVPLAEDGAIPKHWVPPEQAQEAPETEDGSAALRSDEDDAAATPSGQTASQGQTARGD